LNPRKRVSEYQRRRSMKKVFVGGKEVFTPGRGKRKAEKPP